VSLVSYNTVEAVSQISAITAYTIPWPGYDGCSVRNTTFSRTAKLAPSNTQVWYQNVIDYGTNRDPRHIKGKLRDKMSYIRYIMTPYWVNSHRLENYVTKRGPYQTGWQEDYYQYGRVAKWGGSTCSARTDSVTHNTTPVSYYKQQHDYSGYSNYVKSSFNDQDIANAYDAVKADVA